MRDLLTLFIITILLSCNSQPHSIEKELLPLSFNIEEHPDSVLTILDSIINTQHLSHIDKLKWNLLYIRAYEEKYYQLPHDSIVRYTTKEMLQRGNDSDKAFCLFYLGRLHVQKSDYNNAMLTYLQALEYAKNIKNDRLVGLIYSYISKVYKKEKRYDKSIQALKQAYLFYDQVHCSRSQIFALLDIGSTFSYSEQSDSALFYYTKAEVIARQINDKDALASISFQLSKSYWDKNDLESAKYYLDECSEEIQDSNLYPKIELLRTQIFIKQKKFIEAKATLQQLITSRYNFSITMKASNYISMSMIEKQLSNYKAALLWQDKYITLYDSIISIRLNTNTLDIELKQRNSLLEANIQKTKEKNKTYIYLFTISLISCVTSFILYYLKRRNAKLLAIQVLMLNEKNKEYEYKLHQNSILISRINILSKTPSHKQDEVKKELEKLDLGYNISAEDWKELESKVNEDHNNVIQSLRSNYPNLTNEDYQTIILLLLGYKNGEIATILNIGIDSLKKRRQRLRQRLNLSEKQSIEEFINELTINQ
ncbi:tetratricopeptide repeat protein [Phocaeicola sp.]